MKVLVAITGASGSVMGERLISLLKEKGHTVHLIISDSAKKVIKHELKAKPEQLCKIADFCYAENDIEAGIASSSYPLDAMVVVPCSMKTMSAIANGFCDNLVTRVAENILKMGRMLVVVPRDTPLTLAAIENMKKLKLANAIILPPNVAYYSEPKTIDDVTNFFAGKILDVLCVENQIYKRWGSE